MMFQQFHLESLGHAWDDVQKLYTPDHTPEHISVRVTDRSRGEESRVAKSIQSGV